MPPDARDDYPVALLLAGKGTLGSYRPARVTLALTGTDHAVYLHELHRRRLNNSTAWGSIRSVEMRPATNAGSYR
jgi:hypothetical protein